MVASIAKYFLEIRFYCFKKRFLELLGAPGSGFRLDGIFDAVLMLWILVRLPCHELLK